MNFKFSVAIAIYLFIGIAFIEVNAFRIKDDGNKFKYPAARRDESVVENLHGRNVRNVQQQQHTFNKY